VKLSIGEANSLTAAALQAIKQLRQAYIDAKLLPAALSDFHKDLQHLRDKFLDQWKNGGKTALEAVEKEKDNLQPRAGLCLFESLPQPCVTNSTVLTQLTGVLKDAQGGVVQLLGMGGMGKSVLALQAALQLEQGAALTCYVSTGPKRQKRKLALGMHSLNSDFGCQPGQC
jgi:predicted ribonuclease YlaK